MMDNPDVDRKLLQRNLEELDLLNRYFGGHAVTLEGVKRLVDKKRVYSIADLGCGGGDTLKYIAQWARKNSLKLRFMGIDINLHAIQYLKRNCIGFPEISGIVMNYEEYVKRVDPADIYLCSLFCHHLDNAKLLELFRALKRARVGFVINDLQRSAIAYYSAWLFTRIMGGSKLSKNDGPLSVQRAFKKNELEQLLKESGINNYDIRRKWAFRYRIIVRNNSGFN